MSLDQKFENWEAFVTHLKGNLLGDSTVYHLVYETTSLRMAEHGYAMYVAIFETYRQFLGTEYDPGLTLNFIAGMLDHLMVKLVPKNPRNLPKPWICSVHTTGGIMSNLRL